MGGWVGGLEKQYLPLCLEVWKDTDGYKGRCLLVGQSMEATERHRGGIGEIRPHIETYGCVVWVGWKIRTCRCAWRCGGIRAVTQVDASWLGGPWRRQNAIVWVLERFLQTMRRT